MLVYLKRNAFVLVVVCVVAAAASGPAFAELENDATRCLTGTDPIPCHRAINVERIRNKELTEKLYIRACELGDLSGCHGLASFLGLEKGDVEAAISVASKNCDRGYVFSCESAGYYLKKMEKLDDARRYYLKSCSSDKWTLRGCAELGKLSAGMKDKTLLDENCTKQQVWACYANGFAEKQAGNRQKAKEIFMYGCAKGHDLRFRFCEEAFKFISLPSDVQHYFDAEESCTHWRGEYPFDDDRAKEIKDAIEASCKDRSTERTSLRKKYQANPDIVFVLDNLSRD